MEQPSSLVLSLENIAVGVIVYALAALWRYVSRSRFWTRVEERARDVLTDPNVPISDSNEAAEVALLEAQRAQVRRIAKRVTEPPATTSASTGP